MLHLLEVTKKESCGNMNHGVIKRDGFIIFIIIMFIVKHTSSENRFSYNVFYFCQIDPFNQKFVITMQCNPLLVTFQILHLNNNKDNIQAHN